MTSNLGTEIIHEYHGLGFAHDDGNEKKNHEKDIQAKIMETMNRHFRPEFLNRLDEIIIFNALRRIDLEKIVDLQLEKVRDRLARKNIKLKISPELKTYLVKKGFDPVYGARPLKRAIQTLILNPLAQRLLEKQHQGVSDQTFKADISQGEVLIK